MRILCLPYTHTLSHISRPLAIASELRSRGHDIVFAGGGPLIHFIQSHGFEVLPAYQIEATVLFDRIKKGKLQFVLVEELYKMIDSDRYLYQQVKPELVLTDGRFSAPISTELEHINHTAIVNVSSTQYRGLPYIPFFDWLPGSEGKRDSYVWKWLDRSNLFIEMLVFDNAAGIFKKLSRQSTSQRLVTATNCLEGKDLTLLADIEEYFPCRNLPGNYHYTGPLTWKSSLQSPDWWPPRKDGKLLAYFTMGTTWMGGSFTSLHELIRNHHITAIIATGGQNKVLDTHNMETVEGEMYIEDFIDGDLVMEICDVVVCHGGNGTIYQALQHGKPVIGIPTIPDQTFNMRRVKALGVGEVMTIKELERTPERLFQLIQRVVNTPAYSQNAVKLREILGKLRPAEKAADLIEKYFCNGCQNSQP